MTSCRDRLAAKVFCLVIKGLQGGRNRALRLNGYQGKPGKPLFSKTFWLFVDQNSEKF
jgi:hypothetical protein